MEFSLAPSQPQRLSAARALAQKVAQDRMTPCTVGIVFLGAMVRGYFDDDADIDIAFIEDTDANEVAILTEPIEGFEVQTFVAGLEHEKATPWELGKRWAFSRHEVFFARDERVGELLAQKVPLSDLEKTRLMMSGLALSRWYCHDLAAVWERRGDLLSAHSLFGEGLNHLYTALYALNGELPADHKWRLHGALSLKRRPQNFQERLTDVLVMRDGSLTELRRRVEAFLGLWLEVQPWIEAAVGERFEVFRDRI